MSLKNNSDNNNNNNSNIFKAVKRWGIKEYLETRQNTLESFYSPKKKAITLGAGGGG